MQGMLLPFEAVFAVHKRIVKILSVSGHLPRFSGFAKTGYSRVNTSTKPCSALAGIVHQLCPRCRLGRIFRGSIFWGFPKMYERCPVCGLHFVREQGYFLGAMYIAYGLALGMIAVLAVALWAVTPWSLTQDILLAVLLFCPTASALTLLARVVWIYLDQAVDPER
jgi:uncharacterized protein (DUF983 family)